MEQARLIDFHAHILPRADHGSSGIEESRQQMRLIEPNGVDTMVATPHFYPEQHQIDEFLLRIDQATRELAAEQIPFVRRLCLGAEVLYCEHIDKMEHLEKLCIRGTKVMLLELPLGAWNDSLFDTIELLLRRFTIVLAHIDRYVREQADGIATLLEMGALAQINAYSLFSFGDRHRLTPFLGSESFVALGSDLHNLDEKSYQKFLTADKKLGALHPTVMARSAALLEGAVNYCT